MKTPKPSYRISKQNHIQQKKCLKVCNAIRCTVQSPWEPDAYISASLHKMSLSFTSNTTISNVSKKSSRGGRMDMNRCNLLNLKFIIDCKTV